MMVNRSGEVLDGDQILYILAADAQKRGLLRGGVVGTLMSNLGLDLALQALDIPFARSNVGDRYVMAMLKEKQWRIGGENSGHILDLDHGTTGDGIVAGILVLAAMRRQNATLEQLVAPIKMLPQVLVNVRFEGDNNPLESAEVKAAQLQVEAALGARGRVLLRKSGTEPLIRVMVEGDDHQQVLAHANRIADAVKTGC
jgi:phosphoglucosamine mutase